jgi:hypothetical protein
MKILKYILIFCLILFITDCKKKVEKNQVPLEQINIDKSSNYKYILKDIIEKEKKRENAAKKDPFKD